jgi:hypothetical protein
MTRKPETIKARTERTTELLQEIDDFLAEGIAAAGQLGTKAGLNGTFVTQLRNGRTVNPSTVEKVRATIKKLRLMELSRTVSDIREIDNLGGFLVMKPTGEIDAAPDGFGPARMKRLIERGILVPSGDALFDGIPSQTYKVAAHARAQSTQPQQ